MLVFLILFHEAEKCVGPANSFEGEKKDKEHKNRWEGQGDCWKNVNLCGLLVGSTQTGRLNCGSCPQEGTDDVAEGG